MSKALSIEMDLAERMRYGSGFVQKVSDPYSHNCMAYSYRLSNRSQPIGAHANGRAGTRQAWIKCRICKDGPQKILICSENSGKVEQL